MNDTTTTTDFAAAAAPIRRWVAIGLLLLTCAAIMAVDGADPDLWGHVEYGREILRDGVLPRTSTWTHTAVGYRWINHENLSELLLAGVFDLVGTWGLTLGKFALSLFVIGLLMLNRDRESRFSRATQLTLAFIAVVAAMGLRVHWHYRPQILGYTCAAMMFWVISRSIRRTLSGATETIVVRGSLFWVLPILWLWANSHGSFVAGLCILWAYVGLTAIELLWRTGRRELRTLSKLLGAAAGATLLTLVNPYGHRLHLWLLEALRVPRPEIDDWRPLPLWDLDYLSFWVMLLTTLWCVWTGWFSRAATGDERINRLRLADGVVLALVGYQAVAHVRHLPLFALAWGFLIARPLQAAVGRLLSEASSKLAAAHPQSTVPDNRSAGDFWWGLVGVWGAYLAVALTPRLAVLKVDRHDYPVDAFAFMARERLEGRTIVTFNWAQYAIALFADQKLQSTVAFDGRFRTCYPQQVIDNHFDFVIGNDPRVKRYRSPQSPPLDSQRALREADPELVVLCRGQEHSERVMRDHAADWSLLYEDGLAQIWGKRAVFDDPASPRYLPETEREFTTTRPAGVVNWPALPRG